MRPDFLTSPGTWMRSSRFSQSPADYAAAIEHNHHRTDWVRVVVCILACIAIGAMLAYGSRP